MQQKSSMQTRGIKYLDPKNDLTFRKIFGERPHLIKSFLNSMLPLDEGHQIEHVEYLEPELIPELPGMKRSIVDVHCTDNFGRYFIVEMQMYWTSAFKQRMLFNTGKAYVRQLKPAGKYRDLKPVYGLSLVDDIFHTSAEFTDMFYHHYRHVHTQQSQERIEGLELIFIELPKFKAKNFTDRKLQTLWLRFLTEIDENTTTLPSDLTDNADIREALECLSSQAFTEEELRYYDRYWDAIRVEKAALEELKLRNLQLENEKAALEAENAALEAEKEKAKQREKEANLKLIETARQMKQFGMKTEIIATSTGLTNDEIDKL